MDNSPLQPGEMGILQNLNRTALNGLVAEVTGGLKRRILYSLTNPADSEICPAYRVLIYGHPPVDRRIEWCVKAHQIRRLDDPDNIHHANEESVNSISG